MELAKAREVVATAGFAVRQEVDESEYSGSWYLVFSAGTDEYRLSQDGRDESVALERAVGEAFEDVWYAQHADAERLRQQIHMLPGAASN